MARRKKVKILEPDPELKAFRAKKGDLQGKLTAEQARVEAARQAVLVNAQRAYDDPRYRAQTLNTQLTSGGYYCSTRACELERASGYTLPNDITVAGNAHEPYNKKYKAGDPVPIVPGTRHWAEMAEKMGYARIPASQIQPGDRVKVSQGTGRVGAETHSMIAAPLAADGEPMYYYDSGDGKSGADHTFRHQPYSSRDFSAGYRYVGATPQMQQSIAQHRQQAPFLRAASPTFATPPNQMLKTGMSPQGYAARSLLPRIPLPQVPLRGQASTMTPDQRRKARAKRRRIAEA